MSESGAVCAVARENDEAPWTLEIHLSEKPEKNNLSPLLAGAGFEDLQWTVEKIPDDIDWLARSYEALPAFSIRPFFIYGAHFKGDVPGDQTGLLIDAATAFGTGRHGTTKGCLQALLALEEGGLKPRSILDMGTGSGILAIAAWKLWNAPVLAADNDAEAVRMTRHHCAVNDVQLTDTGMNVLQSEGFAAPEVRTRAPFDLIIANILAGTLIDMAPDIAACADKNAHVILSGILARQAEEVLSIYEEYGFTLKQRIDLDEWSTLILRKNL